MPPTDPITGKLLVQPQRYVKLLVAVFSLLSALAGVGVGFWSAAVSHGQHIAEQAHQAKLIEHTAENVDRLTNVVETLGQRIARIEGKLQQGRS